MAFDTGIFTDLDDANSIADPMVLVRAKAIQLPANKGRVWEDARTKEDPDSNRKFDIYSRSETQRAGTLLAGIDAVVTTIPVTSSVGLIKGLVLLIEDEAVVIATVPTTTSITVRERGTAGTTAAAHLIDVDYTVIGSAIDDQDLKDIDSVSEISLVYQNYMQTVAEPIDMTRGGTIDPRKGLSAQMRGILEEEALLRIARHLATATIQGLKQAKDGDAPWMTAGLLQQLSDTTGGRLVSTYDVNGVLTEVKLKAALRVITATGTPTDMYVSSNNKGTINEFLGNSAATQVSVNTDMANTIAGYHVDSYNYEGQIINVKIDQDMPDDKIAICNMAMVWKGWKKGDSLVLEDQPALSSRESREAYNGSFFLAVENVGYEHILLTGITQS